jgi:hypothetical protein
VLTVGVFVVARFIDGDSLGSSIVQATIATLVSATVWEFVVHVRKRDDV